MLSLFTKNLSIKNFRLCIYSFQRKNFMQFNQYYNGINMNFNLEYKNFNENKGKIFLF
jgi:hypothetical protein